MKTEPVYLSFCRNAEAHPERVAIQRDQTQWTYGDLEARTNDLAHRLVDLGLEKETPLAILSNDAIHIMASILGVLKSGNAFVTLDAEMPRARLAEMVSQTRPPVFLVEPELEQMARDLAGDATITLIGLDALYKEPTRVDLPDVTWDPDGLCYIYFTSGSTGKIKGVAGRMKSVGHFIRWETNTFGLEQARVSQLTMPSFDASLRDMFVALHTGGTVCVPPTRETVTNPTLLADFLDSHRVEIVHCVPTIFRSLLQLKPEADRFAALRYMMLAGEALQPSDCAAWMNIFGERIQLVNFYGATETTMIKFFYPVTKADLARRSMPIGQPMKGAKAILLDARGQPAPRGSVGEICVRTPYRSLGYYGQPDLTNQVFIANPFNDDPNDLLYKTGDYGRLLPDGNFEMLGRMDHQIKINGLRVEPGELEALLTQHTSVLEAAVVARDLPGGDKRLIAYVVGDGVTPDTNALQQYLLEFVPAGMLPSLFMTLDELPRAISGKIDRKALPAPASFREIQAYVPPRTETERALVEVWGDVLRQEQVGIEDNFFALGGQSLLATQVISRIAERFQLTIRLAKLFSLTTISLLAEHIEEELKNGDNAQSAELKLADMADSPARSAPLSFAQERLWFLRQLAKESAVYNLGFFFEARGALAVARLEQAFLRLIERHAILRTTFQGEGDQLRQEIGEGRFTIPLIDVTQLSENEPIVRDLIDHGVNMPYDLGKGPLIRASIYRRDAALHTLVFCVHHIAFDGWSAMILFREIAALYRSELHQEPEHLPPMPIQYADYAVWQKQWFQGDERQQQIDFWKRTLADVPYFLELPYDRPRQETQTFAGNKHVFHMPKDQVDGFAALCEKEHATLFMGLLAVYGTLLRWFSGKDDFLVGTDVANRNQLETESLIGFFVNQLALRCQVDEGLTFRELIARCSKASMDAYNHQDLPFHMLVGAINPERKNYPPLFQVKLVLQNQPQDPQFLDGLMIEELPVKRVAAQLDMVLQFNQNPDGLLGQYGYNSDLFLAKTIERLSQLFLVIVVAVTAEPDIRIGALMNRLHEEDRKLKKAGRSKKKPASRKFKGSGPAKSLT